MIARSFIATDIGILFIRSQDQYQLVSVTKYERDGLNISATKQQ